ncbi:hypothetical protein Tco_0894837 [Tanacetum coccineum]|uniref:Uncharacterized protein n=1 Tax=Tanacetum coccineum TaxID=301880 RepID=A0ABQ5CCY0_9ASTR
MRKDPDSPCEQTGANDSLITFLAKGLSNVFPTCCYVITDEVHPALLLSMQESDIALNVFSVQQYSRSLRLIEGVDGSDVGELLFWKGSVIMWNRIISGEEDFFASGVRTFRHHFEFINLRWMDSISACSLVDTRYPSTEWSIHHNAMNPLFLSSYPNFPHLLIDVTRFCALALTLSSLHSEFVSARDSRREEES